MHGPAVTQTLFDEMAAYEASGAGDQYGRDSSTLLASLFYLTQDLALKGQVLGQGNGALSRYE
jgi:hypothetical protein